MPGRPLSLVTGLQGKHILLGVTGSIAAYKAAQWTRHLTAEEAVVSVVFSSSAGRFISPLTFAALSHRRVYTDMFDADPEGVMAHINLPRESDVVLIAPATAQTIARLAHGHADDLLSTCVLAAGKPVVLCPAMNTEMLRNPATQSNLDTLRGYGYHVVEPGAGSLACGEVGHGRLTEWEPVRELLLRLFNPQDLKGKKVLISAGPTREPLDPARFLSNRSSGKMGYALARTARRRGAEVILVSGPVALEPPPDVTTLSVDTAESMCRTVLNLAAEQDIIVKAAAVADFRPAQSAEHKLKKGTGGASLNLEQTTDILALLGRQKPSGQLLVGFAAESRNHQAEGRRKLKQKNADLIVVNDILGAQTGFDVDTNQVWLVDESSVTAQPLLSKEDTANGIWNKVLTLPTARRRGSEE